MPLERVDLDRIFKRAHEVLEQPSSEPEFQPHGLIDRILLIRERFSPFTEKRSKSVMRLELQFIQALVDNALIEKGDEPTNISIPSETTSQDPK